jgi:tetratricopeptide (TPR) repeat protein
LLRELGDRDTEAVTLGQLGNFELEQGLVDEAVATLRASLALAREIGNRRNHAFTLRMLGDALLEHGDAEGAREALEQALGIMRLVPNVRWQGRGHDHLRGC